jgi:NhaP-type Na+/H+ or K+/H+ antiporter
VVFTAIAGAIVGLLTLTLQGALQISPSSGPLVVYLAQYVAPVVAMGLSMFGIVDILIQSYTLSRASTQTPAKLGTPGYKLR